MQWRFWQTSTAFAGLGTLVALAMTNARAAPAAALVDGATERLAFDIEEGSNLNSFLRQGPVAAHLLLRSGARPRILVAFPAGNSGVGLWFAPSAAPVHWNLTTEPQAITATDHAGRQLHGIEAEATVTASDLGIKQAVLSSVRVLRDYEALGKAPASVLVAPELHGKTMTWARDRLDGAAGYRLSIAVAAGDWQGERIVADADGKIGLKITALTGEVPLTPLVSLDLLEPGAAADPAARNALAYLSYREKFLAGSWRFDTYFGRDTLMSMRLLMPVLAAPAVEAGLGAVLRRLAPTGAVAHEEDIGEFAVLDHQRAGEPASDRPVFDYKMIDGNFMLGPVAVAWLLDDERGRRGAAAFLARADDRYGRTPRPMGADLVSNLRLVLGSAGGFAGAPRVANLVSLHEGETVGQWRDSGEGLGRGRFPYDVNAVFVPAALDAAARLYASGLLDAYLDAADHALFARASEMARTWAARAPALFDVDVPNPLARRAVAAYAAAVGVPAAAALESLGQEPVRFHALALDAAGKAIPILNSDEGFALLFGRPTAPALTRAITAIMRPFPAGLMTDVGMLVANPAYAQTEVQARFGKSAYHGTVVWSWQQAVLAAGLAREQRRTDLPEAAILRLRDAQRGLWRAIDAARSMRNSELWSWAYRGGRYEIAPFGASQADADESNAAQLWSTVFLAIPRPLPR
jgi:hypothetical protein